MKSGCHQCWWAVPLLVMAGAGPWLAAQDAGDLPLPRWSEEELGTMSGVPDAQAVPGSMLWPPGMLDITPPVTLPWYLGEADSPDADQPHADVSLFLPQSLLGPAKSFVEAGAKTPGLTRQVVSAAFMDQVAASPASTHLIDPGQSLMPSFREDLTRFVESHARDAQIKLYVLVLGASEMLPPNANLAGIAHGAMDKDHGCLLVYPMGDPLRARLFMSRSVCSVASGAELHELLQDARQDALQAETREDQLHRMLVRMSIRLFWLDRLLGKPQETVARALPVPLVTAALPEVGGIQPQGWKALHWLSWRWASSLVLALMGVWVLWRWRSYKLRHYEWILPEPTLIEPRLGAEHCASGVWMSYR